MNDADKTLVCIECQNEFVHTADEQQRWAERGFTAEPKRCPNCRAKRRAAPPGPPARGGGGRGEGGRGPRERRFASGAPPGPRQFHPATCAACGKTTTVPFKPTEGRPVYCRECFQSQKA